jgi:hypothetical protein
MTKIKIGYKYGRLTVLAKATGNGLWHCQCECGQYSDVAGGRMLKRHTMSCGCLRRELMTTHGGSTSAEYRIWISIISRTTNPNHNAYPWYGGRGIKMCPRWLASFEAFRSDMGIKPSPSHSIDRIDNNGDYEPGNCRWSTKKEQGNNRRDNRLLTFEGRTQTLSQWARELGIKIATINSRIRYGWPESKILSEPIKVYVKRRSTICESDQ